MIESAKSISLKYFKIELFLLLFICYIGPIISDVEYSSYEENNPWNFISSLEFRLVYGTLSLGLYASYYWLFLKPLVFKKKGVYLILSIFGFIFVYQLFNKYENWLVARLPFISIGLRARAIKDFAHFKFYFVISYALTRLVFTFLGFAFLIRSLQQEEEMRILKEQRLSSELIYLKAQLQPHFFFNTLNNIYALALKGSRDTAPVVARLAEMMRYILYEAEGVQVPLRKEVEFLKNYVGLEDIRHSNHSQISFDVQGDIDMWVIEPLLLLPLVENAFKHGLQEESGTGFVTIILCVTEQELILQVENSKPGIKVPLAEGGMGLQNLNKRLDLLYNGYYEIKADEQIDKYGVSLILTKL